MSVFKHLLPSRLFTTGPSPLPENLSCAMPAPLKKRKASPAPVVQEPVTPDQKQEAGKRSKKARTRAATRPLQLADLPNDLLRAALHLLSTPGDLTNARSVWPAEFEVLESKWHELYIQDYGTAPHTLRAVKAAGSWAELYKSKTLRLREARECVPAGEVAWDTPCAYELQVALEGLVACTEGTRGRGTSVMFLLDGSGSVTEEDFRCMTGFVATALASIAATHPEAQAGVLQFSNEVRVEVAPRPVDPPAFATHLDTMSRMNGGTNIALAIQRAGQLLKSADATAEAAARIAGAEGASGGEGGVCCADEGEDGEVPPPPPPPPEVTSRVIVLLTDGRVDGYQAREAVAITERLADEQAGVSVHAFGVGRGVDKTELLHIVGACTDPGEAQGRYLGLRTLDESPW